METNQNLLGQLIFLIILVGINAFFASSEIAIISLNDNLLKKQAKEGNDKAKLLYNLTKEPSRFLATIQVGITLSALLASAFAAETFATRVAAFFQVMGMKAEDGLVKTLALIITTIILSYFTLVFGELIPKRLAMQKTELIANFSVKPLLFLLKLLNPFVRLLTSSTNSILKLLGVNLEIREDGVTEEEIRMMVVLGEERGIIEENEKEMIENIFEFNNTLVSEIMTHRREVKGLPASLSFNQILESVIKEKHTRFPVYQENLDNILGILHVKDLLPILSHQPQNFNLLDYLRPAYNVPLHKKTDEVFKELQKKKIHLAVVIDEFGGTAGIVTIEDLLEEIVGNIFDEYDEENQEIETIDENTYLINGRTDLDKLQNFLGVDLPTKNYETISGFIIEQLGRIPGEKETPELQYKNIFFKIQKMSGRQISLVKAVVK